MNVIGLLVVPHTVFGVMPLFFCFYAKHIDDEAKWVNSVFCCVIINGRGPSFCSYITRKSSCLFCRAMITMNGCKLWSSWLRCLVRKIQSSLHRTNLSGSVTLGGTAHAPHIQLSASFFLYTNW